MKRKPYRYFTAVAPTGDPMPWTRSRNAGLARLKVTHDWPFALRQGYRVRRTGA